MLKHGCVFKGLQGFSHSRDSCFHCGGLGVFSCGGKLGTVIEFVFCLFFATVIDR